MPAYTYRTMQVAIKLTLSEDGDLTIQREEHGDITDCIKIEGSGFWLWDELVRRMAFPDQQAGHPSPAGLTRRVWEARGALLVRSAFLGGLNLQNVTKDEDE